MKFDPQESKKPLVRRVLFCTHKERRHDRAGNWHKHARDAHEMTYVDYGAIRLHLQSGPITVKAGECVFIRGGTRHALQGEADMPFNFLNLMFRGNVPAALFDSPMQVGAPGLELVECLSRESRDRLPYTYDVVVAVLTELIVHLLRRLPGSSEESGIAPAYQRHHQSDVVQRTLAVIQQHYAEPLTLKQTSKAVGISESYLHVLLKKETGATFIQLLQRRRVQVAKHLLLDSSMTLNQISAAVGYNASSSFFKIFKRETGRTPATYAKSLGDPSFRR